MFLPIHPHLFRLLGKRDPDSAFSSITFLSIVFVNSFAIYLDNPRFSGRNSYHRCLMPLPFRRSPPQRRGGGVKIAPSGSSTDDLHKHGDDGKATDGIELARVCVGVYAIVRSGCAGFTLFGKNNVRVPSRFAEMSRRCLEDVSYPSTWAETRKFMTGCDPVRYLLTGNFVHAGTTCSSHVRISAFAFPP